MIIDLTKVWAFGIFCDVNGKHHFFFDLGVVAEALTACRKSLLMDSTSFLVGTFFSISFLLFSNGGSL
jgi:hypothetical protein